MSNYVNENLELKYIIKSKEPKETKIHKRQSIKTLIINNIYNINNK